MSSEDFWKVPEEQEGSAAEFDLDQLNLYTEETGSPDPDIWGQPSGEDAPASSSMDWELDRLKALLSEVPAETPREPVKTSDLPPLETGEKREKKKPMKLFEDPDPGLEEARQAARPEPAQPESGSRNKEEKQPREPMKYVAVGFAVLGLLAVVASMVTVAVFYFRAGL